MNRSEDGKKNSFHFFIFWKILTYANAMDSVYVSGQEKCHPHNFLPVITSHDDVIKWKHLPRYWPFVRGIHRSPVNSPHKGQWRRALMFSLICAWTNDWVNNREAGDIKRHHAHYDVTVMIIFHQELSISGNAWDKAWKAKNKTKMHGVMHVAQGMPSKVTYRPPDIVNHRTLDDIPSNLKYKAHQIPTLKCFSSSLAVVFAQSIEVIF